LGRFNRPHPGPARGHCGLQNARNDEQAKAVPSDRRSSQIGPIKAYTICEKADQVVEWDVQSEANEVDQG
jgi:hypothetical protein